MKKTSSLLALLFVLIVSIKLHAQDRLFSASDYMNHELSPESINNLSWRGSLDVFTYIGNDNLIQKSATHPAEADTILTLEKLNFKLKNLKHEELKRFPAMTWIDNGRFYFNDEAKFFIYDFNDTTLVQANEFDKSGENLTVDTKSLNVAYTVKNNLFVAIKGETIQVTNEKNNDIVYGQIPSRNEFGIDNGMYWSPDGKLLAFYKTDQSEVSDYPLVDIFGRIAQPEPVKYPMAGMKSQKVKLGIFNPDLNEIVYLQTPGPENQYITSVTWDPSGRFIYAGILNRDQNHLLVNKYETSTGRLVKTLFEEKNNRYVEPMHGLFFNENDPSKFIWQSRRDGWNHLYLYDTEGNLIKQITKGNWEVTDFLGSDQRQNSVYFESTMESPVERHLYKTELNTGKTTRITGETGLITLYLHLAKVIS